MCQQLAALAGLVDLSLVGVTPAKDYGNPESADHGVFFVALSAENEKGKFLAPACGTYFYFIYVCRVSAFFVICWTLCRYIGHVSPVPCSHWVGTLDSLAE